MTFNSHLDGGFLSNADDIYCMYAPAMEVVPEENDSE